MLIFIKVDKVILLSNSFLKSRHASSASVSADNCLPFNIRALRIKFGTNIAFFQLLMFER